MELSSELEASLREFVSVGPIEVRENGSRVASLTGLSWEIQGAAAKPLLHLWSERCNLTRRVLAITDHSEARLALAVERFGRSAPGRLEFVRTEFERNSRDLAREEYCQQLARLLAEQFPDEPAESLTISQDLEHSLSGSYARGTLKRGSSSWAVLGVRPGETADVTENSLTFALLWLDRVRQTARAGVSGLRLILPKGAGRAMTQRLPALEPRLRLEIYEQDSERETLTKVEPQAAANLSTWLVLRRDTQALLDRSRAALAPIVALAPAAIALHPSPHTKEVVLRYRGLAFARWKDGRIFVGLNDQREELSANSREQLRKLVQELEVHRHPLATDARHALYRAQGERWLESLIAEDVSRIDAALDPRFVYSQVLADAGGEHGILDLLTVTRSGRLAILELKASEHIHLPLQAADYWLRIRHHQVQGDLARYGYFPGVELSPAPPIVYLVAPALRFHPTADVLLRQLHPEIEVMRVGLTESWRRGLRVMTRQ